MRAEHEALRAAVARVKAAPIFEKPAAAEALADAALNVISTMQGEIDALAGHVSLLLVERYERKSSRESPYPGPSIG